MAEEGVGVEAATWSRILRKSGYLSISSKIAVSRTGQRLPLRFSRTRGFLLLILKQLIEWNELLQHHYLKVNMNGYKTTEIFVKRLQLLPGNFRQL